MDRTFLLRLFKTFSILGLINSVVGSQFSEAKTAKIGCQQRSTFGRDYVGEANTTFAGIPCQRWSETESHDHDFTHVGNHNFCRNPDGGNSNSQSQVWCYTTDPNHERQNCSVPFCPPLKALDFSLDNDKEPDETNTVGPTATHTPLFKRKTFLLRSQSAPLSW